MPGMLQHYSVFVQNYVTEPPFLAPPYVNTHGYKNPYFTTICCLAETTQDTHTCYNCGTLLGSVMIYQTVSLLMTLNEF